jgi:histone H3/H4
MANLPKSAIARIAKNAGAKRIGGDAVEALVVSTDAYITGVVKKAVDLATHAGRTTVKASDIELAVKPTA